MLVWKFVETNGSFLLIFSYSAITQIRIKISSWNFQHMFIMCLCKFDKKILAITQTACQPQPILAKTLDVSSDFIWWDILKRKKNWWSSRPIWVISWKEFKYLLKNGILKFFDEPMHRPSQYPRPIMFVSSRE